MAAEPPWGTLPEASTDARAVVRRDVIPALTARADQARAAAEELEAVLAGEGSWRQALVDLSLPDAGVVPSIRAAMARLDDRGRAREAERRIPPPELGRRYDADRLEAALTAAWEAEAARDDRARRLLYRLLDVAEAHPGLTRPGVQAVRAPGEAAWAEAVSEATEAETPADRAVADARVARWDEARSRWDALLAGLRHHLVAPDGAPVPSPDPELSTLASDPPEDLARDVRARLALLRPFLDEDDQQAVDAAERAWLAEVVRAERLARLEALDQALQAVANAPAGGDPVLLQAAVTEAEAVADAAEATFDALPDGPRDSLAWHRKALAAVDVEVARAELELARARAQRAADADARRSQSEAAAAAAARDEAEAARLRDPSTHPAYAVQRASLDWTAHAWEAVATFETEATRAGKAHDDTLETLEQQAEAALERSRAWSPGGLTASEGTASGSPADGSTPTLDQVYKRLRDHIQDLRDEVSDGPASLPEDWPEPLPPTAERRARLDGWFDDLDTLADAEAARAHRDLLEATATALDDEAKPREAFDVVAREAFLSRLEDLTEAKALRNELRPEVGAGQRTADARDFLPSLWAEVELLQPQLVVLGRQHLHELSATRLRLLDATWWSELLSASLTMLLALALWLLVRARTSVLAAWALTTEVGAWILDTRESRVVEAVKPQLAVVLRPTLDALVAWWIAPTLHVVATELGLLAEAWALVSVWSAVGAFFGLFLVGPDEARPGLFVVTEATLRRLDHTLRSLAVWHVTGWMVDRVLTDLFVAQALARVAGWVFFAVGAVLVVVWLGLWESAFASRVLRMGTVPTWLRQVAERKRPRLLAPLQALLLGGYLTGAVVWDLLQGRAAQRDGYHSLTSMMDRVRFGGTEEEEGEAPGLDADTIEQLTADEIPEGAVVARTTSEEALVSHFAAWTEDRRRGTVVVTGDQGDGKQVFIDRLLPMMRVDGKLGRTAGLGERLRTEAAALTWLADDLALEHVPDDPDALVEAIRELPPQVHVLDDMQRSFLKVVHGFDALRTLLYVLNATSDRHFWVLVMHRPAWAYLSRLGMLVNLGVVRGVVDLTPFQGPGLRQLVMRRTEAAGLEVDFRRLRYTGPFGASPEIEEERAISSYFRLLAEASGGCPRVALTLWARSLRRGAGGSVDVVVTPDLSLKVIEELDPDDLFVLVALRTMGRLRLDELEAVLHAMPEEVRTTVRELEHRGIVQRCNGHVQIAPMRLVSVTRTLRRRHFLQWAV